MPLSANEIANHLEGKDKKINDRFFVAPHPNVSDIRTAGAASIDLRLGTWFMATKKADMHY